MNRSSAVGGVYCIVAGVESGAKGTKETQRMRPRRRSLSCRKAAPRQVYLERGTRHRQAGTASATERRATTVNAVECPAALLDRPAVQLQVSHAGIPMGAAIGTVWARRPVPDHACQGGRAHSGGCVQIGTGQVGGGEVGGGEVGMG